MWRSVNVVLLYFPGLGVLEKSLEVEGWRLAGERKVQVGMQECKLVPQFRRVS
jgi:hypothetical protein